jgi:hypothetical protein
LFRGEFWTPSVAYGVLAAAAIAAVGLVLGNRAIRNATL